MEHANTPQDYFEQSLEDYFKPLLATPLPEDRMYSRSHMWIKNESTPTASIGIDHIRGIFSTARRQRRLAANAITA